MIRAAVLTISDSSFQGVREDLSGPAVAARLKDRRFLVTATATLPDVAAVISARLAGWPTTAPAM
jgi:molybdopterin biosynthesis enzyme MoaB